MRLDRHLLLPPIHAQRDELLHGDPPKDAAEVELVLSLSNRDERCQAR